jgi:hypothetical protein
VETEQKTEELVLPHFIVIGAQKAGTTSIYRVLSQHPEVQMASQEEVSFFNIASRFQKGLSFYSSHFNDAEAGKVLGEVSPLYLCYEKSPVRIAEVLPEVKLIASLRNPVDRAFSAWRMQVTKGSETRSFSEAVREEPIYIENGRYYQQLSRYFDLFPSEQILVLPFDVLTSYPATFYGELFKFIGVKVDGVDAGIFDVIPNVGGEPKSTVVTSMLNVGYRTREAIRRTRFRWLVDDTWIDRYSRRSRNKVASWNRKPTTQRLKPDRETSEFIIEVLSDDVNKLSKLIGQDLSHWLVPKTNA